MTSWREHGMVVALVLSLLVALVGVQSQHRYLTPPYENDFYGFAERAASLEKALELNGFYPLGYPTLLWLLSHVTGNVYTAAQIVAVGAALAFACISYRLGASLLGEKVALLVLALLAVNPHFWQTALFLGTDMPWAALQCLSLYGCVLAIQRGSWATLAWAGAAAGLAYLLRYTALISLPVVVAYLVLGRPLPRKARDSWKGAFAFVLAFWLLALPQLWTSWQARAHPFFTLQAKNVWFGIYGQGDWAAHWQDVPSDIGLWEVFRLGPGRFLAHWASEVLRCGLYTGALGLGASVDAYRHAALPMRLVLWGFGTAAGVMGALAVRGGLRDLRPRLTREGGLLGLYYFIYGTSVALVFVQPRFLLVGLPLILIGWVALWGKLDASRLRMMTIITGLWLGFAVWNSALALDYYLAELQPPVGEVAQHLRQAGATDQDIILASLEGPYRFHTGYDFRPLSKEVDSLFRLRDELRASCAAFLLLEEAYGARYWPALMPLMRAEEEPPYLPLVWRQEKPGVALFRVEAGE